LARKGEQVFEGLFEGILKIAAEKGIHLGRIQVVDSVHTTAAVNVEKDEGRQKKGKGSRDPDARWGVKGNRRVRDERGELRREKEYFYGYKAHVSLNAETELITSLKVTPGSAYDGHHLRTLVEQDLAQGVGVQVYAGDRGYDDGDNHEFLWDRQLKSALRLNEYRTQKKDANKEPWFELLKDPDYQRGLKERYKVERKFGEAKGWHGLRQCRYLGLVKYALQAYLTAMVLNLKRLVKLLFGVSFRNQSNFVLRAA
jgi:IS5 family transposase